MSSSTAHNMQGGRCFSSVIRKVQVTEAATAAHHERPALKIPEPSPSRLYEEPCISTSTVLYLAYGSNLSAETFLGARGIRPISAANVHVPALDLTFDLAGIPYKEPCFANSRWRKMTPPHPPSPPDRYRKNRWYKGLVGVVYEVTLEDYATIIATEGGGASYEDVVVPCHPLMKGAKTIDQIPTTKPFMAHTLLCPMLPTATTGGSVQRPDPSYAQPSARYLKLITDGGQEHHLPEEYMRYLCNIRPYTITTKKQEIGSYIFLGIWFPIIMLLLGLSKILADDEGKLPAWFANVMDFAFRSAWFSYDNLFKKIFGDGERTMQEEDDEEARVGNWNEKLGAIHL
ncbi:hypothetical protein BP6252_10392 [Coleophoma cylindrospora]|uniref:gamma-glutamylcyclotransferase n=1 Tax=Coleophoma cylindrospora TaxID=1849047 RepID=A0A3D8QSR5_9HELO|nr:hypothetical protein BP6252_10392 [Coleophoma cylindrospora]